ncbi:MAG: family 43 glycosylhydrolase, partial [Treponema sp.]|nr:family 43 glycosylhydrolase [Treponema sp.]
MKRRKYSVPAVLLAFHFLLAACPNGGGENEPVTPPEETIPPELTLEDQKSAGELAALFDASGGFPAELSNSWKIWGHRNPLYTQAFGADPNALVYGDRVYLYMSNDTLEYTSGGQLNPNASYGLGIQGIRMASSADLANWTDHGAVNIVGPANTNPLVEDWTPLVSIEGVDRSWAPSAAWKMINGRPKFFMYWGNGGNGIGVVSADSPTGPWASPLDRLLVDRSTP